MYSSSSTHCASFETPHRLYLVHFTIITFILYHKSLHSSVASFLLPFTNVLHHVYDYYTSFHIFWFSDSLQTVLPIHLCWQGRVLKPLRFFFIIITCYKARIFQSFYLPDPHPPSQLWFQTIGCQFLCLNSLEWEKSGAAVQSKWLC